MQGASSDSFRFNIPEQYESLRGTAGLSKLLKSLLLRRQGGVVLDDLVGDDYDTSERESPDPAMIHTQHHLHRGPGPWLRLEVVVSLVMMEESPREFVNQALHHLGMTVGAIPQWRINNVGKERIPESIPKPTMKHFYDTEMADPNNPEHNGSKGGSGGGELAQSPKKSLAPLNPIRGGEKSASLPVADLVRSSLGKSLAGAMAASTAEATAVVDDKEEEVVEDAEGQGGGGGEAEAVEQKDKKEAEANVVKGSSAAQAEKDAENVEDEIEDEVEDEIEDEIENEIENEIELEEEEHDVAEDEEEEAEEGGTRGMVFEALGSALTSARDSAEQRQQDKGEESFSGTSNGLAGVPLSQYVRVQHALEGNNSFGDRVPSRRAQRRPVTAGGGGGAAAATGGGGGAEGKRPATAHTTSMSMSSLDADTVSAKVAASKSAARQISPGGKHVRPVSSSREQRRRHHPNGPEDVSPSGKKSIPIPSTTEEDEDFVVMLKDDDAEILIEEREAGMATIDETKKYPMVVPVELVTLLALAEARGIQISRWLSSYDAEGTGRISGANLTKALTGLALGVGVGCV